MSVSPEMERPLFFRQGLNQKSRTFFAPVLIHTGIGESTGRAGTDTGRLPGIAKAQTIAFYGLTFIRKASNDSIGANHNTHPAAGTLLLSSLIGDQSIRSPVHGPGDTGVQAGCILTIPAIERYLFVPDLVSENAF